MAPGDGHSCSSFQAREQFRAVSLDKLQKHRPDSHSAETAVGGGSGERDPPGTDPDRLRRDAQRRQARLRRQQR